MKKELFKLLVFVFFLFGLTITLNAQTNVDSTNYEKLWISICEKHDIDITKNLEEFKHFVIKYETKKTDEGFSYFYNCILLDKSDNYKLYTLFKTKEIKYSLSDKTVNTSPGELYKYTNHDTTPFDTTNNVGFKIILNENGTSDKTTMHTYSKD
jgi:hypothetical protein